MMKKLHLLKRTLLLLALIVGSSSVWAATSTVTASKVTSSSASWTGTATETWSVSVTGGATNQNVNNGYAQIGTGTSPSSSISFTTSGLSGTITQIVVNCASKGGTAKANATVGGSAFGTANQSTPTWSSNTGGNVTFNGSASGTIVVTLSGSTGATYIKSITVTYTSGPSISASDTNITFDATSGEFGYTLNNPEDGGVLSATDDVDWITDVTVNTETQKVTFNTTANTVSTPRVGTITMTYKKDDETLATKEVTITQAKAVVMLYYSLATQVIPGRHYIITNGKAEDVKAMGAQTTNNRSSVDVSADNEKISVSSDDGVYEFVIAGDMATGYYTIYDTENKGYLYAASSSSNYLRNKSELDANGKWTIDINSETGVATIKSQGSYTRNWMRNNGSLFSCYGSGQNDIYLFERDGDTSVQNVNIAIASACTDGDKCYGTFSAPFAFVVPADLTVSAVSVADGKLTVTNYETGDLVKANTGVMVSATSAGDKTVALSPETGTEISGNMLKASSVAMTGDNLFYRLTMHEGTQIGFWWGAEDGAAFDIAANKAYLAVPAGVGVHEGLWFDDESTDIKTLDYVTIKQSADCYDLSGRKIVNGKMAKGLYIVNGKKVVVK